MSQEEEDALLAAAIAASLAESGNAEGAAAGLIPEEDFVRAPDPVKNETLIDPSAYAPPRTNRPNHERETFRNFAGESEGTGLGKLFRPPVDLLFSGGFNEAKQKGADELRYLIVNIQAVDEFAVSSSCCGVCWLRSWLDSRMY